MKGTAVKIFSSLCKLMGVLPYKISSRKWHRCNTIWAIASISTLTTLFVGYIFSVTVFNQKKFNTVDLIINSIIYFSDVAAQISLLRTKMVMSVMLKFKQVNILKKEIKILGYKQPNCKLSLYLMCEMAMYFTCVTGYCIVTFLHISQPSDLLEIIFYTYAYSINGFVVLLIFNFLLLLFHNMKLMTTCINDLWDYEHHFRTRYPRHFQRKSVSQDVEKIIYVKLLERRDSSEMLSHLKHMHFILYDLLNAASSFVQVPFLLTLVLYLLHIVVSIYCITLVRTFKTIFLNILPIVYQGTLVGLCCFACHKVAQQVSSSLEHITRHLLIVEPRIINDLLLFQKQLSTCAMTVSICGITTLDSKFLATLGASLTTYLGILFTFRPSMI